MVLATLFFLVGYMFIALEHKIKVDKATTALFLGVLLWFFLVFSDIEFSEIGSQLKEHFEEIAEILFFLLGAMGRELENTFNSFYIMNGLFRPYDIDCRQCSLNGRFY